MKKVTEVVKIPADVLADLVTTDVVPPPQRARVVAVREAPPGTYEVVIEYEMPNA